MMRRGQSTVEWAMVVAVLVVALVSAAYIFVPGFQQSMSGAGDAMKTLYASGNL